MKKRRRPQDIEILQGNCDVRSDQVVATNRYPQLWVFLN